MSRDGTRIKVAPKAIEKLKAKIRELTRRTRGHRLSDIVQVEDCPDQVEKLLRDYRSVEPSARNRQMGATAVTIVCMETMGQRGLPRYFRKSGVSVREARNASKSAHGPWRLSKTPALNLALPARMFRQMGLPELAPARAV